MATPINTIYSWFETGDFPTQAQFQASWSSFWHKDELITMDKIDGLSDQFGRFVSTSSFSSHLKDEDAHHLVLAKKDASNLNAANIISWKAALNVGELPPNILTHDLGDQVGNGLTKQEIADQYLAKPETTVAVPDSTNKWVALLTDAGDTVKMLAADLGKNIANSKLVSVLNAGLDLGANWQIDTKGYLYKILGLADKRSDLSYNRFLGQDAHGNIAQVGYGAMKQTFSDFSPIQALELAQLLNGGTGSEGAMSVNLISPPIIQKIDSNEYILLRGANLKLSALSKKIEILNAVTNVLVASIPDSQIQVYDDGITLVFYYNFKDFPFGEYKIKLTSGSKTYETTLTLTVVNNVNNINLDDTTWNIAYFEPADANVANNASGRSVNIFTPVTTAINYRVALKSSQIFAQGQDFYLELNLKVGLSGRMGTSGTPHLAKSYVGLGYSATPLTLATNSLINANFNYKASGSATVSTIFNNGLNVQLGMSSSINSDQTQTVIFIKTGNLFRTIIGNTNDSVVLSNNSGYSMFITLVGRVSLVDMEVQLVKAYTF